MSLGVGNDKASIFSVGGGIIKLGTVGQAPFWPEKPVDDKWQPGPNTLLYLPLDGDFKDYSGHNNNGTAYGTVNFQTVGNRQYVELNNSAISLTSYPVGTGNPNSFTFAGRTKTMSSTGYSSLFYMGTDSTGRRFNLILNYKGGSDPYYHIQDIYQWNVYLSSSMSSPQLPGQRVYVVYTYEKSSQTHTLYINNQKTGQSNAYSLNIGTSFKYIGRALSGYNRGLAEIVFENGIWTEEQRLDFFNKTKKHFGL